jgi:hypothetical protein
MGDFTTNSKPIVKKKKIIVWHLRTKFLKNNNPQANETQYIKYISLLAVTTTGWTGIPKAITTIAGRQCTMDRLNIHETLIKLREEP